MCKVNIVMYHYVRELQGSRYPKIKGLDYSLFKQQIEFFSKNYNVITMEEIIAYYKEGVPIPEQAMLLTFDDGYIDAYTYILPILNEYKMQGSFFISGKTFKEHCLLDVNKIHYILASASIDILCKELFRQLDDYRGIKADWNYDSNDKLFNKYAVSGRFDDKNTIFFKRILQTILPEELRNLISSNIFAKYVNVSEEVLAKELYLSIDQMRFMKRSGMFFGIHGYDHYWLNQLDSAQLQKDINQALICMDELIDKDCWVMNYPYGSYSGEVVEYVKGKKCFLGLSTNVGISDLEKDNRFILPRFDTNDFPPKSNNYLKYYP